MFYKENLARAIPGARFLLLTYMHMILQDQDAAIFLDNISG